MEKCPFCHSENTEYTRGSFSNQESFSYTKTEGNCTTTGQYILVMNEYLCLDCGMVFKKVSEKNLSEYKDMKQYFK